MDVLTVKKVKTRNLSRIRGMNMSDDFPNNLIELDQIRINRNLDKECTCQQRKFVLDTTNKKVLCAGCGVMVDPYEAMYEIYRNRDYHMDQMKRLHKQRKELINYKPWLKSIRALEQKFRGKKQYPTCPRCAEPFDLEELNQRMWMGKQLAEARIKKFEANETK